MWLGSHSHIRCHPITPTPWQAEPAKPAATLCLVVSEGPTRWHEDFEDGRSSGLHTAGRAGQQRSGPLAVPVGSASEEPPDSQERTSEPPWGAATWHLTRDRQKWGVSSYNPPTHLVLAWLQACECGCKAVARPPPPNPGFSPTTAPCRKPPCLPQSQHGDGGRPQPQVGEQTGQAGLRLGIGRTCWSGGEGGK